MTYLFVFIVFGLIFLLCFYFWASSSRYPTSSYAQILNWEGNKKLELENSTNTYSIISYNIGYLSGMTNNLPIKRTLDLFENNSQKVVKEIRKLNPDFIAFQEIDYKSKRSYDIDQLAFIAKETNFPYAAKQVNWDKKYLPFPYWPFSNHFGRILSGQAISSKFPIKSQERIVLEGPDSPFYRKAFYIDRLLQISEIDLNGQTLILMNVHLEAYEYKTRETQAEKVLEIFKEYAEKYPVILAGDFNSEPIYSDVLQEFQEKTIRIFLDYDGISSASIPHYPIEESKLGKSFPADKPTEKLDYFFYNHARIELLDFKVLESFGTASDHLPIWMQFKLIELSN